MLAQESMLVSFFPASPYIVEVTATLINQSTRPKTKKGVLGIHKWIYALFL